VTDPIDTAWRYEMNTSRRGLLKALGLGGVGLVTVGLPIEELISKEADRLKRPERLNDSTSISKNRL
jgi:hypothetical protein